MKKNLIRLAGAYFLVDGLSTLFYGRRYIQLYQFGRSTSLYHKMIAWLLNLPIWQLRGAGAVEAFLGLVVIGKAPMDVISFYRFVAAGYAAIDPGWRNWFYRDGHNAFDRALSHRLSQGGDVLDLGCGIGANLARLTSLKLPFNSYTGLDLTDAMLEQAIKRYGNLPNVIFKQADLMRDQIPDGPYDLIISTWVFEHLPDPVLVAEKAWERLRPGGQMALLFETRTHFPLSKVINLLYASIGAHLLSEDEYHRFPGRIVTENHFWGLLGELTLLVLVKPSLEVV